MRITVDIYTASGKLKDGTYPIKVLIHNEEKGERIRKRFNIPFTSLLDDWDKIKKEPRKSHPNYETLYPYIYEVKTKISKLLIAGVTSTEQIKNDILNKKRIKQKDFIAYCYHYAAEQITSTETIYTTPVNELKLIKPIIYHEDLKYSLFKEFRLKKMNEGLASASVHSYLRALRAMYNEYCKIYEYENRHPFKGVFHGLGTRSQTAQKNYLPKKQLRKFFSLELSGNLKVAQYFWMLQFCLGGQDLKDVVYLMRNDIYKDRVTFRRKKLANGSFLNNRIFPEAWELIQELTGEDPEQLFDVRLDDKGYQTFRSRIYDNLREIQRRYDIKMPNDANLGIKTARHTFANTAKKLFVEVDLIRELMGHERKDVDTYYKDAYPKKVKDKFHYKIIKKAFPKDPENK